MADPQDIALMQAALTEARQALGGVWPNPAVGCVIVAPDGAVVGQGATQPGGRPHAEVVALRQAGDRAQGATAVITLEPCSHHGATPPCAEALVAAGIARAVIATVDPDPRVNSRGVARLRAGGLDVRLGVLEAEAKALNAGFFLRLREGRPLVTAAATPQPDQDGQLHQEGGGHRLDLPGGQRWWIGPAPAPAGVDRHLPTPGHSPAEALFALGTAGITRVGVLTGAPVAAQLAAAGLLDRED